jgi:hypothetical protein
VHAQRDGTESGVNSISTSVRPILVRTTLDVSTSSWTTSVCKYQQAVLNMRSKLKDTFPFLGAPRELMERSVKLHLKGVLDHLA